jgi:hypothetical protein
MLKGHLNYFAVPGNDPSLRWLVAEVRWRWLKILKRRSQFAFLHWDEFARMTDCFFPPMRIRHPQLLHRLDARRNAFARHPRHYCGALVCLCGAKRKARHQCQVRPSQTQTAKLR